MTIQIMSYVNAVLFFFSKINEDGMCNPSTKALLGLFLVHLN